MPSLLHLEDKIIGNTPIRHHRETTHMEGGVKQNVKFVLDWSLKYTTATPTERREHANKKREVCAPHVCLLKK